MKLFTATKISRIRYVIFFGFLLMTNLFVSGQGSSQADLSIISITIMDDIAVRGGIKTDAKTTFADLKCTITIHNGNGGLAFQSMLLVQLPAEIKLLSVSGPYTEYKSLGNRGWPGALLIELSHISAGTDRMVEITFTRSASGNKVGAFAFSGSSDPNPANNFKEATY